MPWATATINVCQKNSPNANETKVFFSASIVLCACLHCVAWSKKKTISVVRWQHTHLTDWNWWAEKVHRHHLLNQMNFMRNSKEKENKRPSSKIFQMGIHAACLVIHVKKYTGNWEWLFECSKCAWNVLDITRKIELFDGICWRSSMENWTWANFK